MSEQATDAETGGNGEMTWDAAAQAAAEQAGEDGWEPNGSPFRRAFPVPVPAEERLQAALRALALREHENELREEAKERAKEIRAEADRAGEDAAVEEGVAKTGSRQELHECRRLVNWRTNEVRVVRDDDGAVVEQRTLTAEEVEALRAPAKQPVDGVDDGRQTTIDDAIAKSEAPPAEDAEPAQPGGDDDLDTAGAVT